MAQLRERDAALPTRVRDWVVDGVGDGRALIMSYTTLQQPPAFTSVSVFIHGSALEPLRTVLDELSPLPPELGHSWSGAAAFRLSGGTGV